jgi:hypothetical protein
MAVLVRANGLRHPLGVPRDAPFTGLIVVFSAP